MAQFDVHSTHGQTARLAPYVVAIQAGLLASFPTVVVAPLHLPRSIPVPIEGLHVRVVFKDRPYILAVEQLVSLPRALLGKASGSLAAEEHVIKQAIDLLFFGI